MADHPSCYSKASQRVTTREARHTNQLPSPSQRNEQPSCSKRAPSKPAKDKQGGSEENGRKASSGRSRRDRSGPTSVDSPARKKKKPKASRRNLSSSSSRQSAVVLSSSESNEELSRIFEESATDKRSSLRSNPRASLLEGLTFSSRRRSTSTKGKSSANKSKERTATAAKQQPPSPEATSQRPSRRRTKSVPKPEDPSKAKPSAPLKIGLPPRRSPDADDPEEPGTSKTSAPTKTSRRQRRSRERSRSSNRASVTESESQQQLPGRPTRGKRKLSNTAPAVPQEEAEGSAEKKSRRAKSKAPAPKKSSRKLSGSTQINTGSCASTRRRAATKEGGRLRSTNATLPDDATSSSLGNLPGTSNAATMSGSDGRQFPNPGNAGENAEGGGTGTDNAEAGTSSVGSFATSLSFEQDSDVGRLQALLEARGVPSHLFGTLGPRMHQILQRTVLGSSVYKVQVILQNLQSKDENQQFSAALEMCQILVMGNEDTLAGFPTRQVVPALISLLKGNPLDEMGTNFDVMHHACRALTYMMEALPRSSSVVVDAVPVFLEKLQSIQCMDVAEQSLQALEMLSKKHHKAILHANGVASCLMFLDFFSLPAQRTALSITANCCQSLSAEEFNYVRSSLPTLANLLSQQDKKLLESVCLSMSRLVENFHSDEDVLREIATGGFLNNMLTLLVSTPPLISSNMFVTVVHMLATMCATCPGLAVELLNLKIADTLCSLLVTTNQGASLNIELTPRTPQELYEIVCLIGELMPKLPTDGIFSVDQILKMSFGNAADGVVWQWLDDRGVWHQYALADCRIIESALQSGEREVNLCIFGVNYTVDFESHQQINEDTGTTRQVKRKAHNSHNSHHAANQQSKIDAREVALKDSPELGDSFIKTLFCVLYEVYNSSAGSSIRHKCLQALMRIIYYGNAEPLKSVLPMCNVSSHIAAMMASTDLKVVVVSIQMAFVLVEKLPEIFNVHFCREGVMHQIKKLRDLPATSSMSSLTTPDQQLAHPSQTGLEVMDLSASASSNMPHQQQIHPVILSTPTNSNHNNGGAIPVVPGSGRSTRNAGFPHQPLLSTLMPPPLPQQGSGSFRQSFLHVPPHLATPYARLPPPPPPYPSFHIFQEPTLEFPPPPPLPSAHPFLPGQLGGSTDAGPLALGPTGRSSPVSPRLKISNVLKHKKVSSRRMSGGKSGRGATFSSSNPIPPQMAPAVNPSSASVGLMMDGGQHQQPPLTPQILQMPGFYAPGQPQQPATPSELHGLLGDVDQSSHLRQNRWNSKPQSFLQGLKWNRSSNRQMDRPASPLPQGTMVIPGHHLANHQQLFHTPAFSVPPPSAPMPSAPSDTREKIRQWICEQATKFCEKYYGEQGANNTAMSALTCLNQLCSANNLLLDEASGVEGLRELSKIMMDEDVSPFEMIHSGVLDSLLSYLTPSGSKSGSKSGSSGHDLKVSDADMAMRYERAKTFLTVFLKSPLVADTRMALNLDTMDTRPFQSIVMKLMACFHHLEQFQVKVHDLPAGSSLTRGGNNAIRFFDTHQIKCNLQRHPSCTTLKQWKGGPVKIDPLALVQAIERYLLMRGFAKARQSGDDDDEEDEEASDDEIEEGLNMPSTSSHQHQNASTTSTATPATAGSGGGSRRHQNASQQLIQPHSIEFVLNDRVLPYNMTVYEAIRQFGNHSTLGRSAGVAQGLEGETEGDWESTFGANCIWTNTHTIFYRPATEGSSKAFQTPTSDVVASPKKTKADKSKGKGGSKAIKELDLSRCSSLDQALDLHASTSLTFKDPSLKVLPLLNIMYALSRHWGVLFEKLNSPSLLMNQDFSSGKLTSKANRQLQDPLSIMTGNLPPWLGQIARTSSFLLPFETRQLLFYATAFDRERAMHRVQRESNQDQGSSSENNDRVVPRLERRKATISRDDILKQAEKLIGDMSNFKALLEIQYENEVGTGLGPTMEFYALVSKELQRHDLELWNGEPVSNADESKKDTQSKYTFSSCGLFPSPIHKSVRAPQVNKIRSKFKFLGKFMAKALMDSRMLDLPLSKSLFKWMLNSASGNNPKHGLSLSDLDSVLPMVSKFVQQLLDILRQKKTIEADQSHTTESRSLALSSLTVDGCSFDDLGIDFCLPGFPNIEMKRGGKDIMLGLNNIEEYLKLLVHWMLHEGPGKQLEALKEGFESIFSMSQLSLFYPEEMEMLFCGNNFEPWSTRYLGECCRVDHGYSMDSRPIKFLFEVLSSFDAEQQRLFVQFTTGSPKLPVGGLKSLNPPLTIVRKSVENTDNPDNYLPSVMTCVNYFKLPEYTNVEVTKEKLLLATQEGQKSFHLS